MVRVVAPSLLTEFKIKSLITPDVMGSKPDVGSSNSSISWLIRYRSCYLRLFFACRLIIQLEINQEHEVQDPAGL